MATRGRDLKVSFLTDLDKFTTDDAARGLEDVADAAEQTGRKLRDLDDDTRRGERSVDGVGDTAKRTAERVDDAFDKIAASSRANLRHKLDDDADHAKGQMREVGAEAQDTGREMAASFSGGADDIMGAIQELGANAGVAFGPVGAALSIALGAGLGTFFADWQKKKEKLTEDVQTFTQALIEGQGKLTEEFLNQQITGIDPEKVRELAKAAEEARIPVRDVIRAFAGDPEAIDRTTKLIDARSAALDANQHRTAESEAATLDEANALKAVSGELGITSQALGRSKTAYELMNEAMSKPVVPKVNGKPAVDSAHRTRKELETALGKPLPVPVQIDAYAAAVAARNQMQSVFSRNPITVPVKPKPGQGQGYGVVRPTP